MASTLEQASKEFKIDQKRFAKEIMSSVLALTSQRGVA